ncbi:Transcriptional regulatory protein DegU [Thermoflexales bacterium]|nr:Transcriptional regulatory protein DegU [Thermoflexales bacterium]
MTNKISVVIVDDVPNWLELYQAMLSEQADIEIVGQAQDGIEAEKVIQQTKPDVVILDIFMPRRDGFQTIPIIHQVSPKSKILVVTGGYEENLIARLTEAGISGFFPKGAEFDFIKLIHSVHAVVRDLKKTLHEVKLIIVGQGAVGKTSLVRQILYDVFDLNQTKTEGISINRWQVNGYSEQELNSKPSVSHARAGIADQRSNISLNIWDFGGQEIMHATHQFFLTKRSLYLLVLNSRLTEEENRVEYWLKLIQSFGGESPVLIVGNQIDQHPLDIDRTGLQKKYPNVVGILETSAATGAGIEELKASITKQVNNLPHVRDLLPETWFTVKTKLEGLGGDSNFITYDKYLELCAENEVNDEASQRTLIGFLHDLGVVLHFQDAPRLEALGILNPQWVTNGVYKILNSPTLFQNRGVLTVAMLDETLNLPEYPRGKRLFIVDMMKQFELCYDIEPDKSFLVPDLLPKDEPNTGDWNGALTFQYHYNVLPTSILSRFIVRMNGLIDQVVWRSGVALKNGGNTALVKSDTEDRKVYIWVSGEEHSRRDFLAKIRGEFDVIHKAIAKIEAREKVPVPGYPEAEPVDYDLLLQMEHDNVEVYPVLAGRKMILVNVRELLNGVAREADRQRGETQVNIYVNGDIVSEKTERNIRVGDISDATGIAIGEETRATVNQETANSE